MRILFYLLFFTGSHSVASVNPPEPILNLPKLNIIQERVTTSGISSGAFFAVQFHVAYSSLVSGSGSVAGGAYGCSEGSQTGAQKCMAAPERISSSALWQNTLSLSKKNLIDPIENLKNDRSYIFASVNDFIVRPSAAKVLRDFYLNVLLPDNVLNVGHTLAAHGFLTNDFGLQCGIMGKPWIQNCAYDMANEILDHLDPVQKVGISEGGQTIYFKQDEFDSQNTLFPWGAVYVPKQCLEKPCGLHIAFHGCQMNPDDIQTDFILQSGFQKAADKHGLVVLFPQSEKSQANPNGCWDWFGIYDGKYLTQSGRQMAAVKKIVDHLMGAKSE